MKDVGLGEEMSISYGTLFIMVEIGNVLQKPYLNWLVPSW